jgi:lysyl-tRNA synthetase, class II
MSVILSQSRALWRASRASSLWRHAVVSFSDKSTPPGPAAASHTLSEIQKIRLDKINEMKGNGVVPYAYSYDINTTVSELRTKYSSLSCGEEDASVEVSLAGRIMVRRFFGKLAFFALQDETDTIQLYVDKGRLGKQFKTIQAWTDNGTPPQPLSVCLTLCLSLFALAGDIIGVSGTMKRTEKGELSIYLNSWTMLTKALLPLPDKYHGLTDIETRYRNRHLDMIVNKGVVATLRKRSLIIQSIRRSPSLPPLSSLCVSPSSPLSVCAAILTVLVI